MVVWVTTVFDVLRVAGVKLTAVKLFAFWNKILTARLFVVILEQGVRHELLKICIAAFRWILAFRRVSRTLSIEAADVFVVLIVESVERRKSS